MADDHALTRPLAPELVESVTALRRAAGAAKSLEEWQRIGRHATPEEIEASEAMRRPTDCMGHSARTGLACRLSRVHGMKICRRHGGSLQRVKAKAAQRLAGMIDPVLSSLYEAAMQKENLNAAVKASSDLLDRSGVGALVQAKVRSSRKGDDGQRRIVVNIGFLSPVMGQPATIVVPTRAEDVEE